MKLIPGRWYRFNPIHSKVHHLRVLGTNINDPFLDFKWHMCIKRVAQTKTTVKFKGFLYQYEPMHADGVMEEMIKHTSDIFTANVRET